MSSIQIPALKSAAAPTTQRPASLPSTTSTTTTSNRLSQKRKNRDTSNNSNLNLGPLEEAQRRQQQQQQRRQHQRQRPRPRRLEPSSQAQAQAHPTTSSTTSSTVTSTSSSLSNRFLESGLGSMGQKAIQTVKAFVNSHTTFNNKSPPATATATATTPPPPTTTTTSSAVQTNVRRKPLNDPLGTALERTTIDLVDSDEHTVASPPLPPPIQHCKRQSADTPRRSRKRPSPDFGSDNHMHTHKLATETSTATKHLQSQQQPQLSQPHVNKHKCTKRPTVDFTNVPTTGPSRRKEQSYIQVLDSDNETAKLTKQDVCQLEEEDSFFSQPSSPHTSPKRMLGFAKVPHKPRTTTTKSRLSSSSSSSSSSSPTTLIATNATDANQHPHTAPPQTTSSSQSPSSSNLPADLQPTIRSAADNGDGAHLVTKSSSTSMARSNRMVRKYKSSTDPLVCHPSHDIWSKTLPSDSLVTATSIPKGNGTTTLGSATKRKRRVYSSSSIISAPKPYTTNHSQTDDDDDDHDDHDGNDDVSSTSFESPPQSTRNKNRTNTHTADGSQAIRSVAEYMELSTSPRDRLDIQSSSPSPSSPPPIPQVQRHRHRRSQLRSTTFPELGLHFSKANNNNNNDNNSNNHSSKPNTLGNNQKRETSSTPSKKPITIPRKPAAKITPGATLGQFSMSPTSVPKENSTSPDMDKTLRRPTRSSSLSISPEHNKRYRKPKYPETIEIDSDSEVEVMTTDLQSRKWDMELTRIVMDKKVLFRQCQATFDPKNCGLILQWKDSEKARRRRINKNIFECHLCLIDESVHEFAYFEAPTDWNNNAPTVNNSKQLSNGHHLLNSFISMKISPTPQNKLSVLNANDRQTIVLEFHHTDDMLALMKVCQSILLGKGVNIIQLTETDFHSFAKVLLSDDNLRQLDWTGDNRNSDHILLVYPFGGEQDQIERAADDLTEASGVPLAGDSDDSSDDDKNDTKSTSIGPKAEKIDNGGKPTEEKPRQRAHFVTIRREDYDRLDPGEWLNDSLVDFWMQWISRDDTTMASPFHFFTSHFFSTLSSKGPKAVASWTERKNINIFSKKLIFIPINKDLHWSLCVVVNPGAIEKTYMREPTKHDPLACMILMDSLKMHNKRKVSQHIRDWLNSEWNRVQLSTTGFQSKDDPFQDKCFRIFSPQVPYQNNTWDCGVFVCRYAYAVYELRHRHFTYEDAGMYCEESTQGAGQRAFYDLISDSAEFNFGMKDIARFRKEFKILIERLSKIYLRFKKKERDDLRQRKGVAVMSSSEGGEDASQPGSRTISPVNQIVQESGRGGANSEPIPMDTDDIALDRTGSIEGLVTTRPIIIHSLDADGNYSI